MLSTELRYFFDSQLHPVLENIISELELQEQQERKDYYFPFEKGATCGVKWREGRLEVKSLVRDHHAEEIVPQSWEKIMLEEVESISTTGAIAVTKKRWLGYFKENLKPSEADDTPNCQLEISLVKVEKTRRSSICLEVSGGDEQQRLMLLQNNYKNLCTAFPEMKKLLESRSSLSYPEFLLNLSH